MTEAATRGSGVGDGAAGRGGWSPEEVVLLKEGLEKFGRDWDLIAAYVRSKTREQCQNKVKKEVRKGRMARPPLASGKGASGDDASRESSKSAKRPAPAGAAKSDGARPRRKKLRASMPDKGGQTSETATDCLDSGSSDATAGTRDYQQSDHALEAGKQDSSAGQEALPALKIVKPERQVLPNDQDGYESSSSSAVDEQVAVEALVGMGRLRADKMESDEMARFCRKVQLRFSDQKQKYKRFCMLLENSTDIGIEQVLQDVTQTFQDHPDLLEEFASIIPVPIRKMLAQTISSNGSNVPSFFQIGFDFMLLNEDDDEDDLDDAAADNIDTDGNEHNMAKGCETQGKNRDTAAQSSASKSKTRRGPSQIKPEKKGTGATRKDKKVKVLPPPKKGKGVRRAATRKVKGKKPPSPSSTNSTASRGTRSKAVNANKSSRAEKSTSDEITAVAAAKGPSKLRLGIWSEHEDSKLRQAIKQVGTKSWRVVADMVETRTQVQCQQRWCKVLDPGIQKGAWSLEEDRALKEGVKVHGPKAWAQIADLIPGRNAKQARERWMMTLNPAIIRGPWTPAEDKKLLELTTMFGTSWSTIQGHFPHRTPNQLKTRTKTLKRAKEKTSEINWQLNESTILRLGGIIDRYDDMVQVRRCLPRELKGISYDALCKVSPKFAAKFPIKDSQFPPLGDNHDDDGIAKS